MLFSTSSGPVPSPPTSPEEIGIFSTKIVSKNPAKSGQAHSVSTQSPSPQNTSTSSPGSVACEPSRRWSNLHYLRSRNSCMSASRFIPNKEVVLGFSIAFVIIAIGILVILVVRWARRRQIYENSKKDIEAAHGALHPVYQGDDKYTRISSYDEKCGCWKRRRNMGTRGDLMNGDLRTSIRWTSDELKIEDSPLSPYPTSVLPDLSTNLRSLSPVAYSDSSSIRSHEPHRWRRTISMGDLGMVQRENFLSSIGRWRCRFTFDNILIQVAMDEFYIGLSFFISTLLFILFNTHWLNSSHFH